MITDEEKAKIKAEEIFRDEVKKSLIENKKKANPFWTFLNSGLGLWFMSTIVIGLFTFLFNEYSHNKNERLERQTKIKQLDLEIESRISQFWVHLDPIVNHSDTSLPLKNGVHYDTLKVFWEAFKNPPSFNPKLMTTIYKDFDSRTTISLMVELSTLLREKYNLKSEVEKFSSDINKPTIVTSPKKDDIPKIIEVRKIEDAATFIGGNGIFYKSNTPTIKEIWNSFAERIIVDRWNMLFPYTDCLFC